MLRRTAYVQHTNGSSCACLEYLNRLRPPHNARIALNGEAATGATRPSGPNLAKRGPYLIDLIPLHFSIRLFLAFHTFSHSFMLSFDDKDVTTYARGIWLIGQFYPENLSDLNMLLNRSIVISTINTHHRSVVIIIEMWLTEVIMGLIGKLTIIERLIR